MTAINLVYREDLNSKGKSVRHFDLESGNPRGFISSRIRLSTDRGYARGANPDFWLHEYTNTKYSLKASSGLFITKLYGEVYSGDLDAKSHLLTVAKVGTRLDVKIRVNQYPFDKSLHPKTVANLIKKI